MSGIFGYFSTIPDHKKILDLVRTIDYSIKEVKASKLSMVCSLDVKSMNSKDIIVEDETGGYIIFCGEIYNEDIIDPKKYILELYENGNFEKLKTLNGSFLAAIYDDKNERFIIINDRFGSKKLFYTYDKNHLYFSPKIFPLMKLVTNKKIRKDALFDFFIFGYFLGDKTFDENIHQLPPASVLEISKNTMNVKNYWTYQHDGDYDARDKEVLIDDLGRLWQKAVDRRIKKNEKIVIEISGGLDSRAILGAALKSTEKENILLYTFGEEGSYDLSIGTQIAKTLDMHHVSLRPSKENFAEQYLQSFHDAEGMIDATPYFVIGMKQSLKQFSNKIYNGYMGGEIMGPLIFSKINNLELRTNSQYNKAKNIFLNHHKINNVQIITHLFNPSYIKELSVLSSFEKSIEDLKNIPSIEFPNYCARWLYTNESDKYTSFCNFRYNNYFYYFAPFLDNDLVDFMLRVPPNLRAGKKLYKQMLTKDYAELFQLPTKNTYGLKLQTNHIVLFVKTLFWFIQQKFNKISNHISQHNFFFNKNQNYIDYDELLRTNTQYQIFMKQMIDKVKKREFFDPNYIDSLWTLHLSGKKNFAMIFGLLVTVEFILEKFYD